MNVWTHVSEVSLILQHEPNNRVDKAAVAIMKDNIIVDCVSANLALIPFQFLSKMDLWKSEATKSIEVLAMV